MRRPLLHPVALTLVLALAACSPGPLSTAAAPADDEVGAGTTPAATDETPSSPSPSPSPVSPSPAPADPKADVFLPAPDRWIPRGPGKLAKVYERVTLALRVSVNRWVTKGDPSSGRPPKAVVLQTLYQQRIYRKMVRKPNLAHKTFPRIKRPLRRHAKANFKAGIRLRSMIKQPLPPDATLKTGKRKPAGELLRYYRKAQRRFGVDWEVLAAINMIESKFGSVKSTSYAGAQGPMQFMPATWDAYGMGGNVRDPHDAIMGAANYLKASGAPGDYRSAVWNYNHSPAYVDAVLLYAKRMMSNPKNYWIYYNWQVYILTTAGDKRLTGPGL